MKAIFKRVAFFDPSRPEFTIPKDILKVEDAKTIITRDTQYYTDR